VCRLSSQQRSEVMRRIKSSGTTPERLVHVLLLNLRYRPHINFKDLPGSPDFVISRRRVIIFVHGCFWHRHKCKRGRSIPTTRRDFWMRKFEINMKRDRRAVRQLRAAGWRILTIWQCSLKNPDAVKCRIRAFLRKRAPHR
jgi:DNA mismatch endonuclease, patch repair protein